MKAHITTVPPCALLYSTEESSAACAVLAQQGIAVHRIAPDQLNQTVGFLAGLGGHARTPYTGQAPTESLLVMSELTHEQINELLTALRTASAAIDYKAVVTKHNRAWTVLALLDELKQERAMLQAMQAKEKEATP
jgi:hypothetical protein